RAGSLHRSQISVPRRSITRKGNTAMSDLSPDLSNELAAWDRDHFFHPSTHMGMHARGESPTRVIGGGEGVYITDTSGKRSLAAFAGLNSVIIGYGRTGIDDAIARQAKELAYYHDYIGDGTEASITLAKMIVERAPKGMSRVYF